MTVYGFSDNLTSPVAFCMPMMGPTRDGCPQEASLNEPVRQADLGV